MMNKYYSRRIAALAIAGMLLLAAPFQALAAESAPEAGTEEQVQEEETAAEEQTAPEETEEEGPEPEEAAADGAAEEDTAEEQAPEEYAGPEDTEEGPAPSAGAEQEKGEEPGYQDAGEAGETEEPAKTSGECGETLAWEYEDGKLCITGSGEMYEYGDELLPGWYGYEGLVTELYLDREVTAVDLDAFAYMTALEDVYYGGSIPEWEAVLFTGSRDVFGDEITEDEIFAGAEIHFAEETGEEGSPSEGPADASDETDVSDETDAGDTDIEDNAEARDADATEEEQAGETAVEDRTVEKQSGTDRQDAAAPVITSQPGDVSAAEGEAVSLTVAAAGSSLTYQWQWSTDNSRWRNCTSAGYNTDTFRFSMVPALDGRYYRCAVTGGGATVYSKGAQITLAESTLEITVPVAVEQGRQQMAELHIRGIQHGYVRVQHGAGA